MNTDNSFAFLSKVFNRLGDGELPIVVANIANKTHKAGNGVWRTHWPNPQILAQPAPWYFSVAAHHVSLAGPKRGKAYFASAHCLVLDDVGTKIDVDRIPSKAPPSWIIETSRGNYQYGYMIHRWPDQEQYEQAMRLIADQGLTDPGAIDAVHLFRLPGSIHQATGFEARLTSWHEKRRYLLTNLLARLGIDKDDIQELGLTHQRRWRDPKTQLASQQQIDGDDVWAFIQEHELNRGGINEAGWVEVICPWGASHTKSDNTGNREGNARYMPGKQAFHCFHASCVNRHTTTEFLNWVNEQERLLWLERQAAGETKATPLKAKRVSPKRKQATLKTRRPPS